MSWSGLSVRLRTPLDRFELDVEFETSSKRVGIFGPSGSGKTTVLECIAGWKSDTRGVVRVGDSVLLDSERKLDVRASERGVGYVPQDALLFPHWSVERNLLAGAKAERGELFERVVSVLDVGEILTRLPANLSGGERQRVALARALLSEPRLLLLDEPLVALDLPLRRRVLAYLARVREAFDVPLLFVSHDPTEVQTLCDHVVVIRAGRVQAAGPPAMLFSGGRLLATDFENVLRGAVVDTQVGTAQVELAPGVAAIVPRGTLDAGDRCVFGLRADDVLISMRPLDAISARNVLAARVQGVTEHEGDVYLTARLVDSEVDLSVSLTVSALGELGLAEGKDVYLVFKTQSCHLLAAL